MPEIRSTWASLSGSTKEEIPVNSEIILLGEDESDFSENITQKHADPEPELTKNEEDEIFNLFESL